MQPNSPMTPLAKVFNYLQTETGYNAAYPGRIKLVDMEYFEDNIPISHKSSPIKYISEPLCPPEANILIEKVITPIKTGTRVYSNGHVEVLRKPPDWPKHNYNGDELAILKRSYNEAKKYIEQLRPPDAEMYGRLNKVKLPPIPQNKEANPIVSYDDMLIRYKNYLTKFNDKRKYYDSIIFPILYREKYWYVSNSHITPGDIIRLYSGLRSALQTSHQGSIPQSSVSTRRNI